MALTFARIRYLLIGLWLAGLVLACIPVLLAHRYLDADYFKRFLLAIVGTFAPPLGIMIGFTFAENAAQTDLAHADRSRAALSVILSLLYVGTFIGISAAFQLTSINAKEAIDLIGSNRDSFSFLISALLAYYFANKK